MPTVRPLLVALAVCAAACGSDTPTSPSTSTTTTTTVAPASISEIYNGTLSVGGSRFYSFTVLQNGTVSLTLTSLGPGLPGDLAVELSLGRPAGTGCAPTSTVNVTTDTAAPHLTGTF